MKKEYKAPLLSVINVEVESLMQTDSKQGEWAEGKKSGRTFEDDEDIVPVAPKKFWDDEN